MAQAKVAASHAHPAQSKATTLIAIDCSRPSDDQIFDVAAFEKYLHDRIKVNGKAGALGDVVQVGRNGATITITSATQRYPKRYLKYLAKKFLKKSQLRDWVRVVANGKETYELRYYNIQGDEEEEEGAEDQDQE